jgi:hypothetical protein
MEEFQYTLNVTPATVQGLDNMVITCSSAVQVANQFQIKYGAPVLASH